MPEVAMYRLNLQNYLQNFWDTDPDLASDQGLQGLHTGISIKNKVKMKKYIRYPLKEK